MTGKKYDIRPGQAPLPVELKGFLRPKYLGSLGNFIRKLLKKEFKTFLEFDIGAVQFLQARREYRKYPATREMAFDPYFFFKQTPNIIDEVLLKNNDMTRSVIQQTIQILE